jgi:hypothetical protein
MNVSTSPPPKCLKIRVRVAYESVDLQMLFSVWNETVLRFDVCVCVCVCMCVASSMGFTLKSVICSSELREFLVMLYKCHFYA